jgi:hypothetical protein
MGPRRGPGSIYSNWSDTVSYLSKSEVRQPKYRLTAVGSWTVYGESLGVASGAHQLIFWDAFGAAIWFCSFGFLSVAIAIPVTGRARPPTSESRGGSG